MEEIDKNSRLSGVQGSVFENGSNVPLDSVVVIVKGTSYGTITDLFGHFTLLCAPGGIVLSFSHIAYHKLEITTSIPNGVITIPDVFMTPYIEVVS